MNVRLTSKEQYVILSDMATMLTAGIPIVEVVESMLDESKGRTRRVLRVIKQQLYQGHTLSQAMQYMPQAFDPVSTNLVSAAEESGTLEVTLRDLSNSIQKSIEFNDQVRGSFVYPVFIGVVFFGVLGVMLGFVIPRMSGVFESMGSKVPPATQWLINSSNFVVYNYVNILAFIATLVIAGILFYTFKKRIVVSLLLGLPFLNKLGRQIDLARFTRSMALLLKAGIPITEALELSRHIINKKELIRLVVTLKTQVAAGHTLSEQLKKHEAMVTPTMVRLVDIGERSGTLERSFQELASFFETRVSRVLKTLLTLLEPTLLLVIGGLVGGMMVAIVAPMYSIMTSLGS